MTQHETCTRGLHPLTPENVYARTRSGVEYRICKLCRRDAQAAYRQREKKLRKERLTYRHEQAKPIVAGPPVEPVWWKKYQLDKYDEHLRGEKAVGVIVREFWKTNLHWPRLIACIPVNICKYTLPDGEEVVIRAVQPGIDPPCTETEFLLR